MKTNAVVLIVSAGVGAALVGVGACSSMMGNKAKKVVIEDGRIFIPGTSVSQTDQDSVMAILGQYKRSLYKIQTYKDGNPIGKPHGALADKIIGEATVAQVTSDAKQTLFPDGESKSVVLVHRIRLRLLNLGRHLGQVVVHLTLRKYRLMRRHRAN